jgi:tetratricopeptide (TPR) repeat protein
MGKFFVPPTSHTPADRLRESLDKIERMMPNLRGTGAQVLRLAHMFDQAAEALVELEEAGMDVRAERARFESAQRQLRRRQGHFLAEAGKELKEERAAAHPDRDHWWWFLDEERAQQRRRQLRKGLIWGLIGFALLAVAWLAYNRFLAPSPQVREAFQHSTTGETLVEEGDLRAALAEFEAATALTPDDPDLWVWQGVLYSALGESDKAETAFETARALSETNLDFLLSRSLTYLRTGNLDAASADVEQAIHENPDAARAYYIRASVATEQGDLAAALEDLERTAELAQAAGNTQLEATARMQRAMVMQMYMAQPPASPGGETEPEGNAE